MHKLEVRMEGPGRGTVTLDGYPIAVRSLQFNAGVDCVNTVQLNVPVGDVTIDAADVRRYQAEGQALHARTEGEIAQLLARLERESGTLVSEVVIESLEATQMHDHARRYVRRVRIVCDPVPGSQWEGASP